MPDLPMRLVDSVRSAEDVIYADGLGDDAVLTFTRDAPASDPTCSPARSSALCATRSHTTSVTTSRGLPHASEADRARRRVAAWKLGCGA